MSKRLKTAPQVKEAQMSQLPSLAWGLTVLLTPDIRLYDLDLILLETKNDRPVRLGHAAMTRRQEERTFANSSHHHTHHRCHFALFYGTVRRLSDSVTINLMVAFKNSYQSVKLIVMSIKALTMTSILSSRYLE